MGAKQSGGYAGTSVDELRGDLAAARGDLGDTTEAGKADVKARTQETAAQVREGAQEAVESVRRRPGMFATAVAGMIAAAAAIGMLKWRRARQTPKSRARRAWKKVSHTVSDRMHR